MFLALSLSDAVFIMLLIVRMPTIVGILTFISRINFVRSWVEHENCFITSGPGPLPHSALGWSVVALFPDGADLF